MISRLTPKDWELISTYLDGQLSDKEKRQVQDLIALRPELKQGLEDLRRTRAVLRAAPRRRAPRNFTLTPEMARKARPRFRWGWTPSFSFASAMAAILLVLSFFFRVNLAQLASPLSMAAQAPVASSQESAAATNPPIIIWNAPGVGGGGPGVGYGGMGGANDSTEKLVAPSPSDSQLAPEATPLPDVPPALAAGTTPEPTVAPKLPAPLEPQTTVEAGASRESGGNNPILGIAPTEEQGKMIVPEQTVNEQARQITENRWIYVQVGLAGVTLIFALAAFLTWRKTHH